MSLTYEYGSSPLVSGDELTFTDVETKVITVTNTDTRRKTVSIELLGAGFILLSSSSVSIEAGGTSDISVKSVTDTPGSFSTKLTVNDDFFTLILEVSGAEDLYTTRSLIESKYGKENVRIWADLDGNYDQNEIESTIYETILNVMAYIDAKLSNGAYTVPFSAPIPRIIKYIATTLAGCELYAARAMFSDNFDRMVANNKKTAMQTLAEIERGFVNLGVNKRCENIPVVVEDD